jgi:hypothetical protein
MPTMNLFFRPFLVTVFATVLLLLNGCVSPPPMALKGSKFSLLYEEKPNSILVLPPVNNTTAADAKEYYATTVSIPLASTGFYVIPVEVTNEILKAQGLYDTEMLGDQPLDRFREYFGADAVLFTKITRWDTSYAVLASTLTVSVDAKLKSTRTNRELWAYTGTVVVDLSGGSGGSGNIIADLLVKAVVTAISTAAADYVPIAQQANFLLLSSLPTGKYHYRYGKDQGDQIIDLSPSVQPKAPAPTATVPEKTVSDKTVAVAASAEINSLQPFPPQSVTSEASAAKITPSAKSKSSGPAEASKVEESRPVVHTDVPVVTAKVTSKKPGKREVKLGSAAENVGIRVGDEIISFDNQRGDFALMKTINAAKSGTATVVWKAQGRGSEKSAAVKFN